LFAEVSDLSLSVSNDSRPLAVTIAIGISGNRFSRFLKKSYINQWDRQNIAAFGNALPRWNDFLATFISFTGQSGHRISNKKSYLELSDRKTLVTF
jgi:transglutaminase-like putative cysteine protease